MNAIGRASDMYGLHVALIVCTISQIDGGDQGGTGSDPSKAPTSTCTPVSVHHIINMLLMVGLGGWGSLVTIGEGGAGYRLH